MSFQGIDTAANITAAQAAKLAAEGVSFAGRYLVPASYGKAVTAGELRALRGAGIAVLLCWELEAEAMRGGAPRGASDGARARQLAEDFGVPAGTCIYFACDYGAAASEFETLAAYLRAAGRELGPYRCGVYGGWAVVEGMAKRGACDGFWQCCAWSGGRVSARAGVYQSQWQGGEEAQALGARLGFAVDLDTCADMAAAGLWLPEAAQSADGGGTGPEPGNTSSGADAPPSPQGEGRPWYAEAMAWAAERGLLRDGRPDDPVTRAELATVLRRLRGEE